MNNKRRKQIENLILKITFLKEEASKIQEDEQDYYDNIPENLQSSIRAEESEEAIEIFDDVMESMDDIIERLGDIQ